MPKSLRDAFGKNRRQDDGSMKDLQGRVHYNSPRAAESWDAPEHYLRFEDRPVADAMKVLSDYRTEIAQNADGRSAQQVFAERRAQVLKDVSQAKDMRTQNMGQTAPKPFVDLDEAATKSRKRGWLRRLFGRKSA